MPEKAEPIGPHSKRARELKVKVKALHYFADGTLFEFFKEAGYPGVWPANEERAIPKWLFDRCVQSGGEFEPVE